jgi:hypothetical protein
MRATFSGAESTVMDAASYTIKEQWLARLEFLLDKRELFKEGAIALEALSGTTNGDADRVVMNPACQLPKFFEASNILWLPLPATVDETPFGARIASRDRRRPRWTRCVARRVLLGFRRRKRRNSYRTTGVRLGDYYLFTPSLTALRRS